MVQTERFAALAPLNFALRFMFALILVGTMTACESTRDVAEAVNPVNWFEEEEEESVEPKPIPGEDAPYPNLGTVPEAPAVPEIKREYAELRDGLLADKSNARYSDEIIRKQAPPSRRRPVPAGAAVSDADLPTAAPPEPPTVSQQVADASPAPLPPAPQPTANSAEAVAAQLATSAAQGQSGGQNLPPNPVPPSEAANRAPAPVPLSAPQPRPLTASQPAAIAAAQPPPSAADLARNAGTGSATVETASPAGQTKLIATIYFPDGGARLSSRDLDVLNQVGQIYGRGGQAIRVIGHSSTDKGASGQVRGALLNYKVSLDRATAVAQALMKEGVSQSEIQVDARGAKEPLYAESTAAGVAGNRRAEIYITF